MKMEFESLGSMSGAVMAVALLFAAALAVGGFFVRPASRKHSFGLDALLVRIPVGLSLIAAVGACLGAANCLSGPGSVALLAALALLAFMVAWRERGALACQFRAKRRLSNLWLALPPLGIACATLGPALCYPTGWDELVYHQVLPRRWQADGWPAVYADLPYSGFPSLGEILFWLLSPLDSAIAPRLLVWVSWLLGLALVYRLLLRRLAATSAITILLAFAVSETALMISANCYVE